MPFDIVHALKASRSSPTPALPAATLLVAGATGALGNEVLHRLVGTQRFSRTRVLAREPFIDGLRGVATVLAPDAPIATWPAVPADVGLIMFDPPRLYYDRERALWTPSPAQWVEVAAWMRRSGVRTLAVVLPHAQGRLPEALKRGLAGLDEHAVATLGFDRVLLVRSARKPVAVVTGFLPKVAAWMLSILAYMVPSSEQPVRASKVAEFVDIALRLAPPGIHIAAPETVWRAAQGDMVSIAARWLGAVDAQPA